MRLNNNPLKGAAIYSVDFMQGICILVFGRTRLCVWPSLFICLVRVVHVRNMPENSTYITSSRPDLCQTGDITITSQPSI